MGIIRAQMGVLFRKAEATITGSIMRTWAQKMVLALPSMKFMARSRPNTNRCTHRQQQQHCGQIRGGNSIAGMMLSNSISSAAWCSATANAVGGILPQHAVNWVEIYQCISKQLQLYCGWQIPARPPLPGRPQHWFVSCNLRLRFRRKRQAG